MFDADSVAALIHTGDGRYLLQHRDHAPHVDFPGCWGLFGGSRDGDESHDQALLRELREELGFAPETIAPFLIGTFDLRPGGRSHSRRRFYEVRVEEQAVARFRLGEGQDLGLFSVGKMGALGERVIPFDLCAVILHAQYRGAVRP